MTDDEIIAIRKGVTGADPTKPWADSIKFARAILDATEQEMGAAVAVVVELVAVEAPTQTYPSERYIAAWDAARSLLMARDR